MVTKKKIKEASNNLPYEEVAKRTLFSTVSLKEIVDQQFRMEAAAYSVALRAALREIKQCNLPVCTILGSNRIGESATNAFRFKRHYVDESRGVSFLSSSNIIELGPKPEKYLSKKLTNKVDQLKVAINDILISCSGTVGNVSLAGKTIEGMAISQHVIRLKANDPKTAGYLAAFLRSKYGRVQLTQSSYGSVVTHIEPHHLENILIPNPHPITRSNLGQLMLDAVEYRDTANTLLKKAESTLHERLGLPPLKSLKLHNQSTSLINAVKASDLSWRFEASYHTPLVNSTLAALKKAKVSTLRLDDDSLTDEVRPITKFRKRVYVKEGGIPLLSSKQLFQVDPIEVKKLAKGAHTKDLEEIALKENMLFVTRSGTIGRVGIIPAYMDGWAGSEHATRIVAVDDITSGFLYAWLASDYGHLFITRHSYGSVILEIDKDMLSSVPVPSVSEKVKTEIGKLVLKANRLRNAAWEKEREAIDQIESLITGKQS